MCRYTCTCTCTCIMEKENDTAELPKKEARLVDIPVTDGLGYIA